MAPPTPRNSGRLLDFRSDTVTRPTDAMRQAAFEVSTCNNSGWHGSPYLWIRLNTFVKLQAEVGDDVYGEDPTVNRLQEYAAKIMGKEAALLVPTGTMGNLSAVLAHCPERGTEASDTLKGMQTGKVLANTPLAILAVGNAEGLNRRRRRSQCAQIIIMQVITIQVITIQVTAAGTAR